MVTFVRPNGRNPKCTIKYVCRMQNGANNDTTSDSGSGLILLRPHRGRYYCAPQHQTNNAIQRCTCWSSGLLLLLHHPLPRSRPSLPLPLPLLLPPMLPPTCPSALRPCCHRSRRRCSLLVFIVSTAAGGRTEEKRGGTVPRCVAMPLSSRARCANCVPP